MQTFFSKEHPKHQGNVLVDRGTRRSVQQMEAQKLHLVSQSVISEQLHDQNDPLLGPLEVCEAMKVIL